MLRHGMQWEPSRAKIVSRRILWLEIAALALLCGGDVGCGPSGPSIAPVSGIVRLDGKPLTIGKICFASENGFGGSAELGTDGRFRMRSQYGDGIPVGTYRVMVAPPAPEGPRPMIMTTMPGTNQPSVIPPQYQDFQTSRLTAVVERRSGEFTFDLKHANR